MFEQIIILSVIFYLVSHSLYDNYNLKVKFKEPPKLVRYSAGL
jgi:hypothetical protein|uniref:Uncharacterized protein n=1 Tax=viral metagenome TaxID=1070528 RepID=A0A6C0JRE3_9ZZZZ